MATNMSKKTPKKWRSRTRLIEKFSKFCEQKKVSCKVVRNFKHCQVAPKELFDQRSFRVKTVDKERNIKITIGCPNGKYNAKKEQCRVGTQTQKIMYPKDLTPSLMTLIKLERQGKRAWC